MRCDDLRTGRVRRATALVVAAMLLAIVPGCARQSDAARSSRAPTTTTAAGTSKATSTAKPGPRSTARPGTRSSASPGRGDCALTTLPREATTTAKLIRSGGPFPHPDRDGVVFGNYEGRLPAQNRGFYHEYTVPTPGSPTRGARRIVTGGTPLTAPPNWYYTGDHYETFCRIGDA